MRTVIQLKETNFGVWFSAVKGIRVISSHSPPLCTDYQDQNREDLESRHILQNRPHYQYLIISLSSQLIITRGHVPHGPALNLQGGRGGAYPTNNNASIPKKKRRQDTILHLLPFWITHQSSCWSVERNPVKDASPGTGSICTREISERGSQAGRKL